MNISCIHSKAGNIQSDPGLQEYVHAAIAGQVHHPLLSPAGRGLTEFWEVHKQRKHKYTREIFEDNLDTVVVDTKPDEILECIIRGPTCHEIWYPHFKPMFALYVLVIVIS